MTSLKEVGEIDVRVNGAILPPKLLTALIDVEIQEDLQGPAACRLLFFAWNDDKADEFRVDDALFDVGNAVEIKLGDHNRMVTVIKAEIVALEFDLTRNQTARFSVRAYDRSHRLRRGTHQRTYTNMKESDIAAKIADQNGLSAKVEDSREKLEYVLQDNQTDYDFLQDRAARIDYEMIVDDKNLVFRPRRGKKTIKIDAQHDLTELSAHLRAADQVGAVEVRGWDPKSKKTIVGKSSNARKSPTGTNGDGPFGKATLVIVDREVSKQDEADHLARAEFERRARRSMGIEGHCLGRADLRAGVVVDIESVGKRFGGTYRLTSVMHRFSAKGGFQTTFSGEKELA